MEPEVKAEKIPDDRSVIVVSDMHLGLKNREQVSTDFSDFLAFIRLLVPGSGTAGSPSVMVDGKPKELLAPAKIILLGDIIDLWSPRGNNRASVLADSYPIIQSLFALPTEIVYIAGNHDNEIAEIEGSFPVSAPGKLTIIKRHYPDSPPGRNGIKQHSGIPIGDHRYFFMHGQQFDLLFNAAGLLQDYPGWVAKNYSLFKELPRIKWFFWALFGFSLLYVLANIILKITTLFDGLVYILLGLSVVIVLFSIEPTAFRAFWDKISLRKNTKTETIESIIETGFWKTEAGDNILADIVVFGHTHIADDSKDRYLQMHHKRFINSGSWGDEKMKTSDGRGVSEKNTFVYIDKEGPVLFRWPDKGPLPEQIRTTLTGNPAGPIPPASPIKQWMRRNIWTSG